MLESWGVKLSRHFEEGLSLPHMNTKAGQFFLLSPMYHVIVPTGIRIYRTVDAGTT